MSLLWVYPAAYDLDLLERCIEANTTASWVEEYQRRAADARLLRDLALAYSE